MAMKHGGRGPGHLSRWTAATSPIPYLFASGSQGAWFDFTDTSTWYQDAARTTPAATLGDVVGGIADKSGRGNHASQATTAQKPLRARIPLGGRRNMLTYTEDFSNAVWDKGTGGSVTGDAYTWATSTASFARLSQYKAGTSTEAHTFSIDLKRPAGSGDRTVRLQVSDVTTSTGTSSTLTVTESWQTFTFTRTSASATGSVGAGLAQGTTGTPIAVGEVLNVRNAQLERASSATAYQKVVADWDVTESGVTSIPALYYDGSDDSLATAAIDFTGTDKMTVFAGVEKLSDAAIGWFINCNSTTAPSFSLRAPGSAGVGDVVASAAGSLTSTVTASVTAPATMVVTMLQEIASDTLRLRTNTNEVSSAADQGTGNLPNAAVHLGQRSIGSSRWRGYMIGHMVIVGKLANASEIAAVEATERAATGAY